jgi:hypothetical protein
MKSDTPDPMLTPVDAGPRLTERRIIAAKDRTDRERSTLLQDTIPWYRLGLHCSQLTLSRPEKIFYVPQTVGGANLTRSCCSSLRRGWHLVAQTDDSTRHLASTLPCISINPRVRYYFLAISSIKNGTSRERPPTIPRVGRRYWQLSTRKDFGALVGVSAATFSIGAYSCEVYRRTSISLLARRVALFRGRALDLNLNSSNFNFV